MGEWRARRNASLGDTQLAAAIFGAVKNNRGSSSSHSLPELLFYILYCAEQPAAETTDTSRVDAMSICAF